VLTCAVEVIVVLRARLLVLPLLSSRSHCRGEAPPVGGRRGAHDAAEVEPQRLRGAEPDSARYLLDAQSGRFQLALRGKHALADQPSVRSAPLVSAIVSDRANL